VNGPELYCDGGVALKNPSPYCGTWAWLLVEHDKELQRGSGIVEPADVGLPTVSNNLTELLAALRALQGVPEGWEGTLFTDSGVTMYRIAQPDRRTLPKFWYEMLVGLKRTRKFQVVLVGGHPTKADLKKGFNKDGKPVSKWNVACDKMCRNLAQRFLADEEEEPPARKKGFGVFAK
jgi:ribonuclease HI